MCLIGIELIGGIRKHMKTRVRRRDGESKDQKENICRR